MANLLKSSGRTICNVLDAADDVINNSSNLVATGTELLALELRSSLNDLKEELEAANNEEVSSIRAMAIKQEVINKYVSRFNAAERKKRELEQELRELELKKKEQELELREQELELTLREQELEKREQELELTLREQELEKRMLSYTR